MKISIVLSALLFCHFTLLVSSSHNSPDSSNRYPPYSPSHRTHSSSQNSRPQKYLSSNSYDTDYSEEADVEDNGSKEKECFLVHTYENAYPKGLKDVPSAIELKVSPATVNNCGQACCELGSDVCQYIWIVGSKCMAVSCPPSEKDLCNPVELERDTAKVTTNYYKIGFGDSKEASPTSATTTHQSDVEVMATMETQREIPTTASGDVITKVVATEPPANTEGEPSVTPPTEKEPTPSKTSPLSIQVGISGDTTITLPTDTARIHSSTFPKPDSPGEFLYRWSKLFGPQPGYLTGKDSKDIVLSGLVEGTYGLKLTVDNFLGPDRGHGVGFVNITVLPASRHNTPPTPIISPSQNIETTLPSDTVLVDASKSVDDQDSTNELSYQWEEITGPVGSTFIDGPTNNAVLRLINLEEGHYKYKLTLTDSDRAQSVAFVNVTVLAGKDYPPTAIAGNPVLMYLPKDDVFLYGNKSTDDKPGLMYEWQKLEGPGAIDLQGSHTSTLHVLHLVVGDYVFQLTVTDSSGQSNSATVSVVVRPEENTPPVANAGENQTVIYPISEVVLDGSRSHDDYKLNNFTWVQISGPIDIEMSGIDGSTLTVSGLHIDENEGSPTLYQFMLTVVDYRELNDSDIVTVMYRKDPTTPPKSVAGPNVTITLPQSTAILNGSGSHDDFGIISYQWERSPNSPAAGIVVDHSDTKPVLILSDLVNGTYNFVLTVTNKNKEQSRDNVTLMVLANPLDPFLLQVNLEENASNFSKEDLHQLDRALRLILDDLEADYEIIFERVRPAGPYITVEFYAVNKANKKPLNATVAYSRLTDQGQDYHFARFHILQVEMKVCQLPCSGHGFCNTNTKRCQCSTFWMENPIKAHFGRKETNCEWSIFYVVLVGVAALVVVFFFMWLCCCCCLKKRRKALTKRRVRYAILDHKENEESMQMLPRDGFQQTSLMVSESETEEEILFESTKKKTEGGGDKKLTNGKLKSPTHSV